MNLFSILKKLDTQNYETYNDISDKDRKEFDGLLGYPLLRWMSGVDNEAEHAMAIQLTNLVANPHYFDLYYEKPLQCKLLASSGMGYQVNRKWVPAPKKTSENKAIQLVTKFSPQLKPEDVRLWFQLNDREDFKNFCRSNGVQEEELKTALKDYKDAKEK
jgi:hypothetical protein